MKKYDINQVALMTGVTTRTLRNYIQMGVLKGQKEAGKWYFTEVELGVMFETSFVKQELEIKDRACVKEFIMSGDASMIQKMLAILQK